jgi:hypothetical protein
MGKYFAAAVTVSGNVIGRVNNYAQIGLQVSGLNEVSQQ